MRNADSGASRKQQSSAAAQGTPVINLPAVPVNPERRPDPSEGKIICIGSISSNGAKWANSSGALVSWGGRPRSTRIYHPARAAVSMFPKAFSTKFLLLVCYTWSRTCGSSREDLPLQRQITGFDKLHSNCDQWSRLDVRLVCLLFVFQRQNGSIPNGRRCWNYSPCGKTNAGFESNEWRCAGRF